MSQIRDGPGHLQDPVVPSGTEIQFVHRVPQESMPPLVEAAVFADLGMVHPCVAGDLSESTEALGLNRTSLEDPLPHLEGRLGRRGIDEIPVFHRGSLDMQVDAVEQGSGDFSPVALDLSG